LSHGTKLYASDLTDQQWTILQPLVYSKRKGPGRPIELDLRQVLNAIFYVMRTGCQWQYLPREYPNYNSVYYHYRKWCKNGTWERLNTQLRQRVRQHSKRKPDPSAAILDSQSVKTTEVGGERGYDAGKKINGRKRHILVDTLGNLLTVVVHPANMQDYHGAKLVLLALLPIVATLQKIWADGIYKNGGLVDWVRETFQITLDIVNREPGQKGFTVLPRRWVVERTFAWLGRYRRLSKDYEKCTKSSEGAVYVASINLTLRRLTAST
jgi:putative transposase